MNRPLHNIVILGGGTAGWMSASLLARALPKDYSITLVESETLGTVGVGEATIPPIQLFNNLLGLDEQEFLQATGGTIKLGIQFENWDRIGDSYMHAFGNIGRDFGLTHFHHYWLKARQLKEAGSFWDYSFNYQAAKNDLFAKLDRIPDSPLQGLVYAYHFDAGRYALMLRQFSEGLGVTRLEGMVCEVTKHSESGYIQALKLEDGRDVKGDLFIDCSGFRGRLIEQELNTGYESWGHWLQCDRAVAAPSKVDSILAPYTRAIAHPFGWQWKIPLQHRCGNGIVYSSRHIDDDEAIKALTDDLGESIEADPRVLRFDTGRRKKQWNKNVVAIGLSSGFLEPLESTSIHLIQQAITRLIRMLPAARIFPEEVSEYNRQSQFEFEKIRDFIILHYHLNRRTDSEFWKENRSMEVPESLRHKIELFRNTGKLFREQDELFSEVAWHQVLIGQGVIPEQYHPLADSISEQQLRQYLSNLKLIIQSGLSHLKPHHSFLSNQ